MVFPDLSEFRKAVITMAKSGTPFMRAVQLLFDEIMEKSLAETAWPLACREGCHGQCCRKHVVFCREPEIDLIISVLKGKEIGNTELILHQAECQAAKWADHCRQFQNLPKEVLLVAWQEKREPCAFLDLEKDSCLVYPVRPLVCRSWISLKNREGECRPCNFIFAREAQRVVEMRAMERGLRKSEAIPVSNWLAVKAKELFK